MGKKSHGERGTVYHPNKKEGCKIENINSSKKKTEKLYRQRANFEKRNTDAARYKRRRSPQQKTQVSLYIRRPRPTSLRQFVDQSFMRYNSHHMRSQAKHFQTPMRQNLQKEYISHFDKHNIWARVYMT